jgi:hypothetical protein
MISTVQSLKPVDEVKLLDRMKRERGDLLCMALEFIRNGGTGTTAERMRQASEASGIPEPVLRSQHFSRSPRTTFSIDPNQFVDKAPGNHEVKLNQKAKLAPGQESFAQANPGSFIG